MEYKIRKSKNIPILWLDTFVITQIATALYKKREGKTYDNELLATFCELVTLRINKQIIIFESDQILEIAKRPELLKTSSEVLSQLSGGLKVSSFFVRDRQIASAIETFLNKPNSRVLSWRDIFHDDPLKDRSIFGFIPRCDVLVKQRTDVKNKKDDLNFAQWKKIQKQHIHNGERRKFKQQYELERTGGGRLAREVFETVANRTGGWSAKYAIYQEIISRFVPIVKNIQPNIDNPELTIVEFYESDYYMQLPNVRISSILFAERLCGNEQIKCSDQTDIDNIAAFFPYINYMLLDSAMIDKIKKHKLDKEYSTQAIRIKDLKKVIKDIKDRSSIIPEIEV